MVLNTIIEWQIIFFGTFVFAMIELLFLVMIIMKTPATTYLGAWLKKKPILLNFGRDRILRQISMDHSHGVLRNKKIGKYIRSYNAAYIDAKSGMTVDPTFSHFAHTISPEMVKTIEKIVEDHKIETFDEFDFIVAVKKNIQAVEKWIAVYYKQVEEEKKAKDKEELEEFKKWKAEHGTGEPDISG